MFSAIALNYPITLATSMLYVLLAAASCGVTVTTRAVAHSKLRMQINSWWLIFPLVTVSLLLGPPGALLLFMLIGALTVRELAFHLANEKTRFRLAGAAALSVAAALSWYAPALALSVLALLVSGQLASFIARKSVARLLPLLLLATCLGTSCVIQLARMPLPPEKTVAWLFYLFVLTALNDIGQFVAGTVFGRGKIAVRISPNKTWQGLAGGVFVSALLSLALGSWLQLAAPAWLLLVALMLAVGGFCGDLMFSAAKRYLGIKDFSNLIPGHGGILDRVDSLVLTAPLLYFAIRLTPP
ncbi:MAG: phosphatidate cytidylyltransferase [Pseudomonadota bacterium]